MFKQISFSLIIILTIVILIACAPSDVRQVLPEDPLNCILVEQTNEPFCNLVNEAVSNFTNNNYKEIIDKAPHFRIFTTTDLPSWYKHYEVYNHQGEIVYSFMTSRPAWIKPFNDNVLEISVSVGTGTRQVKFYCMISNMFSEYFFSPFHIKDELVAEMRLCDDGEWALVIQDIFEPVTFYKRFLLENLPPIGSPFFAVVAIEYLGDNRIEVTHLTGNDYYETSVILHLC